MPLGRTKQAIEERSRRKLNTTQEVDGKGLTVFIPNGHQLVHLVGILDNKRREIFDIDTNVCPLSNLQPSMRVLPEEIPHFFIIDLHVRHTNQEPGGRREGDFSRLYSHEETMQNDDKPPQDSVGNFT